MVPDEWQLSVMGDHVDLLTGFAFKSKGYTSHEKDIHLLRGDNIAQGYLRWRDAKRWPHSKVKGLEKYYLNNGDFVIAMDRTWIPAGVKVSEVTKNDLPCLLVQRVSRLRASASLEPELLRQYFSSHHFAQQLRRRDRFAGVGRPSLPLAGQSDGSPTALRKSGAKTYRLGLARLVAGDRRHRVGLSHR